MNLPISQHNIFKVVTVCADSDHPLASYVEDEEEMFVTQGDNWWIARDFFYIKNIYEFHVEYKRSFNR